MRESTDCTKLASDSTHSFNQKCMQTHCLMFSERARLQTFYQAATVWGQRNAVEPEELAQAGFYYLQDGDRVKCAWCGIILRDWAVGDIAIGQHRFHSKSCEFLTRPEACGNVLINREQTQGVPKHSRFSNVTSRLKSLKSCSWKWHQDSVKLLAVCGFFYSASEDTLRCFYCDGSLEGWTEEKDPWVEHAKRVSNCKYLEHVKGRHFIDRARQYSPSTKSNRPTSDTRRYVNACIDTPTVKVLLDMGYDEATVKTVLEQRLLQEGEDFQNASDLFDAVQRFLDFKKENGVHDGASSSSSEVVLRVDSVEQSKANTSSEDLSMETPERVEEEHRLLKQQMECKICWEDDISVVFTPCGHMVACEQCAKRLKVCPLCRSKIRTRVQAHFSAKA